MADDLAQKQPTEGEGVYPLGAQEAHSGDVRPDQASRPEDLTRTTDRRETEADGVIQFDQLPQDSSVSAGGPDVVTGSAGRPLPEVNKAEIPPQQSGATDVLSQAEGQGHIILQRPQEQQEEAAPSSGEMHDQAEPTEIGDQSAPEKPAEPEQPIAPETGGVDTVRPILQEMEAEDSPTRPKGREADPYHAALEARDVEAIAAVEQSEAGSGGEALKEAA